MQSSGGRRRRVLDDLVVRVVIYHALFAGALYLLYRLAPGMVPRPPAPVGLEPLGVPGTPARVAPSALRAMIAMLAAVLLAVPVAWIYVLTRAKRGYQQSVVQTLVILPMVVAGVVAVVKDSLSLAFGLAGIVAAVRFRTAIDDSKDAVYIFLATGLGLAAAVDLQVALVVATVFNAVMLVLWQADFGRTPAAFEGRLADRRLDTVMMEELNRTGTFVARIDDEVFQDMTAEQLQAVADRAWRRARRNNPELPDREGKREALLRVRTEEGRAARGAIEPLLDEHLKRWRYGGVVHEADGVDVIEYIVLLRRSTPPEDVLAALRAAGPPTVIDAHLD